MATAAASWSLATHFCGFVIIFPIGLRRLLSFYSHYLKPQQTGAASSSTLSSLSVFRAKPWYMSVTSPAVVKDLDLYILLIALPIASFSDLYLFLSLHRLSFLHHAALLSFFSLLLLLLILRHHFVDPLLLSDTFLFLFSAVSFLIDYYLILNGNSSGPITTAIYALSSSLSLLLAGFSLHLAISPYSFASEFFLSSGLLFKSTWLLQTGLNLYSDMFSFNGCQKMVKHGSFDVKCDLQEDALRGVALVNLLFVCHAIGVLITSFALFALLASYRNLRIGDAGGPLLAQQDATDNILMRPQFEIE